MQNAKYDTVFVIGRFQPFHNGHAKLLQEAFSYAPRVVVLIGSANSPRTIKNPFSYNERKNMIEQWHRYYNDFVHTINIHPIPDTRYDDAEWIKQVAMVMESDKYAGTKAILGHSKDESSYYLDYFKHLNILEAAPFPENHATLHATSIRELWFEGHDPFVEGVVPSTTLEIMHRAKVGYAAWYPELKAEYDYIKSYRNAWLNSPYPPTFVTVDAVVIQSGHILMIKRGQLPGKHLFALPGGFVNQKETLVEAVIRELREETKLKVAEKVLRGSIRASHVFDDPDRSLRGRTISHAFLFRLDDKEKLPRVRGADDAKMATWIPFGRLATMQNAIFEDHYDIAEAMMKR